MEPLGNGMRDQNSNDMTQNHSRGLREPNDPNTVQPVEESRRDRTLPGSDGCGESADHVLTVDQKTRQVVGDMITRRDWQNAGRKGTEGQTEGHTAAGKRVSKPYRKLVREYQSGVHCKKSGDRRHNDRRPARKFQRIDPEKAKPPEGFVHAIKAAGTEQQKHQDGGRKRRRAQPDHLPPVDAQA